MPQYTLMSYNIEHMNRLFDEGVITDDDKVSRAEKIAAVILGINPHLLGISEAANGVAEHQHFIDNFLSGSGFKLAHGMSRGAQDLVFYHRDPFRLRSIDRNRSYYEPWNDDVDADGLKERHRWERKPLEAVFEIGQNGPQFRVILVHTKSKGVFSVVDLQDFMKISQANRVRLLGQAKRLRKRIDNLRGQGNPLPTVVLGDLNDGPGLDPYERVIGKSFVETVMGNIFEPNAIFHNTLSWMLRTSKDRKNLWTADFPDPIVRQPLGFRHRVWLDHILVSPEMLDPASPIRHVTDSGRIGPKGKSVRKASDHFAVYCQIETA